MSSTIPHRYVTPSYPGAAGFDLFNVISGGTGGSGSAYMDTAKVGGPNAGTYAVAFGEDATSNFANRGLRALAQNTDYLDNLLHRLIATTVRTADVTAGSPVSAVTLPVNTFLGTAGYNTSPASLNMLFEITDSNDDEIIDPGTGGKVRVSSVTLGSGDSIGGGGANGNFSGNTVQLNISPSIPTSTTYRIYYGTQTDLADLPIDALTTVKIRGADEIDASVENLFRLLHGNNESWNAAWDSTIWDLTMSGINERYNRSTGSSLFSSPPESYFPTQFNGAGAGAWFLRTGPAITGYTGNTAQAYADPMNALFVSKFVDTGLVASGGMTGFVAFGSRRTGAAWTGETTLAPGAGTFMALWPHNFQNTIHATNPYTRILDGATAAFTNVGSYDVDLGEAIVQVTQSGNYFRTGGGLAAISLGYDLIQCTYNTGGPNPVTETYVIVAMGASNDSTNTTKVRVRRLNGTVPNFVAGYTGTIRWISLSFGVGDGAGPYHNQAHTDTGPVRFDGLYYQVPVSLSAGVDDNIPRAAPRFVAQNTLGIAHALDWGGFNNSTWGPVFNSFLQGDGGINVTNASINLDIGNVNITNSTAIPGLGLVRSLGIKYTYVFQGTGPLYSSGAHSFVLDTKFSCYLDANIGDGPNGNLGGLVLWIDIRNAKQGQVLIFTLNHSCYTGGTGGFTIDWTFNGTSAATNRFSGGDDQILPGGGRTMWTGMCVADNEIWWTCTRL